MRHCYRILRSSFEAEDAVQETFVRAWRGLEHFRGGSAIRTWLYRIATNVCLTMLAAPQRRAQPASVALPNRSDASRGSQVEHAHEQTRLSRSSDGDADPANVAVLRESVRLALVALQRLPPRQRAVLILRDVLRWRAGEVAELLETTVPSVNSALQRARARLAAGQRNGDGVPADAAGAEGELLARYHQALQHRRIDSLVALLREDARSGLGIPRTTRVRDAESCHR